MLIMKMNNKNLLIRVYNRSVSVTFIFLFSAAIFLFQSWRGSVAQLCFIGSLMFLYDSYRDNTTVGPTYYAFLLLGIGSLFEPQLFLYLPIFWLMMKIIVYSLSWRTFFTSLLGLITPYWMLAGWIMFHAGGDFAAYYGQIYKPGQFDLLISNDSINTENQTFFLFTLSLFIIGCVHFLRNSFRDKIRVRQIYYSFMLLACYSFLLLLLFPHHDGLAIRILIITTSPLFAHFTALTNTKLTNLAFCIITVATILLTGYSLWTSSSIF